MSLHATPSSDLTATLLNLSTATLQFSTANLKLSSENAALQAKLAEKTINEDKLIRELQDLRTSMMVPKESRAIDDFSIFTCFPRLPLELKRVVWKYGAHHPRVVEVRKQMITKCDWSGGGLVDMFGWEFRVFNNAPPAILLVNKESRGEALQYYKLGALNGEQYKTYLNINSDILYLTFHFNDDDRWENTWAAALSYNRNTVENTGWGVTESKSGFAHHFNRIAVPIADFDLDLNIHGEGKAVKQFAGLGTTEIILVDQRGAEDDPKQLPLNPHTSRITAPESYPSLNLSRNLHLIPLDPQELLKRTTIDGPRYSSSEDKYGDGLVSVEEYLKETKGVFEKMVVKLNQEESKSKDGGNGGEGDKDLVEDNENGGEEDKGQIERFNPFLTIMRLKFCASDVENGEENGKNFKRKITLI